VEVLDRSWSGQSILSVLLLLLWTAGPLGLASCASGPKASGAASASAEQPLGDTQQAGMVLNGNGVSPEGESNVPTEVPAGASRLDPIPGDPFASARIDGDVRIRNLVAEGPVYADFISFSAVSAFNRHPESRRFLSQDPDGVRLVQGLYPHAIRFPGGSFTRKFFPKDDKGQKLLKAYQDLARESGEQRCILVLNIFAGTQDDARYLINSLRSAGIEIVAVELGNEYHIKKYRKKYPDARAMIEDLKPYAALVQQELPGVPMGLPVPSSRHVFDAEQFGNRAEFFEDWTNTLAEAVRSGELPVQAVIPHFYKQTHTVYKLPSTQARFDGVMEELRIDSYGFLNQVVIDYYTKLFGDGIELWITEWGLKEKQVYGNTMAEGLHVMGFLLDMAEGNRRNGGRIKHSCYQKMAGPVSNAAITPKGPLPTMEPAGDFQPGTAWYAFHDFGGILDGAQYVRADIAGPGQDKLRMACFRREGDLFIAFANRTGQYWRMDIAGRMSAVWADKAWASNGSTFWSASGEHQLAQRIDGQLSNVIPPFGYGVLKADWEAVQAR
jgi:hypothetical protein